MLLALSKRLVELTTLMILDNCISRLRVIVKDGSKVADDEVFTKNLEAMGVIRERQGQSRSFTVLVSAKSLLRCTKFSVTSKTRKWLSIA